ncbi:hypothetical protein ACQEU8_34535 [Streptomyces sp. CA-250714]|uniref:hypothetical protein n=1 Tax=Streptomyces sp. CA-250714 TaxID=3240060 RepID=UPI003D8C695E
MAVGGAAAVLVAAGDRAPRALTDEEAADGADGTADVADAADGADGTADVADAADAAPSRTRKLA